MIDLRGIGLVVFDVDGTLYDQRALRLKMAAILLRHCLAAKSLRVLRVLGDYRRTRETFAEDEVASFEPKLVAAVASRWRMTEADVASVVAEWIDRRPLPLLARCRYPGVVEAFGRLRASGLTIGVLSDYPAPAKLLSLGLHADVVVSAGDPEVNVLKPAVRGLEQTMAKAGATAAETVMIGDRAERDGEMARRLGVRCYLRSTKPIAGWDCFNSFGDFMPETNTASVMA